LLGGPYGAALAPLLTAPSLTAPSVAATRAETWVVRDGDEVVRVPTGAPPQSVNAPGLAGLGVVTALRLSPDGVRAAVILDGNQGPTLYLGTVTRSQDGGVGLGDLREIAPTLSQVVDVAWRSGGTLIVLAADAGQNRTIPYTVGVDGFGLDDVPTSGLPPLQPTAVAAAPSRQPLVDAGGTIWQYSGGIWTTLIRGAEPVPGTAPFYPM
jgi:hypothetical protein